MKIKVSEATTTQLDWLVAKCENHQWRCSWMLEKEGFISWNSYEMAWGNPTPAYSTDWSLGGQIIEREGISIIRVEDDYVVDSKGYCTNKRIPVWCATTGHHGTNSSCEGWHYDPQYEVLEADTICGPTPLISAMRFYVISKLGSEVEVPESLIES